jgi:ligand-binding sensor domain-containing protein
MHLPFRPCYCAPSMIKSVHFVIAIFLSIVVRAQNNQPQYEHINVENGLPSARVTKCLQDKLGYIWIGTENGLVRYDGYVKKVYKLETGKPQNLTSLNIQELFEDSKGNIWVGTFYDGVFRYNRDTDLFTQYKAEKGQKNGLATNDVHSIREDGAGNLYFYTYDHTKNIGFLNQFNPATNRFRKFGPDEKGADRIPRFDTFPNWFKDKSGNLWIAGKNGLYSYSTSDNRFKGYLTETDSSRHIVVTQLYQSPSQPHILYFANVSNKREFRNIVRFNTADKSVKTYPYEGLKTTAVGSVLHFFEDKNKRLWIGTNQGLSRLDSKTDKLVHYPLSNFFNGVKSSEVFTITEDNTGLLWLSVANGMLNFNPATSRFTHLNNIFTTSRLLFRTGRAACGSKTGTVSIGSRKNSRYSINIKKTILILRAIRVVTCTKPPKLTTARTCWRPSKACITGISAATNLRNSICHRR